MSDVPRLRSDLVVRRMGDVAEPYVMVKDPVESSFYKFEPWEGDVLALLDGERDAGAIAAEFNAAHPERPVDPSWVVDYTDGLRSLGLVERTDRERHLVMMDKLRTLRKRRFRHANVQSLFMIQLKLFDPDRAMDRIMPAIRWLWSPWVIGFWAIVFAGVLGFLVRHWDMYWAGFFNLIDPSGKDLWDWLGLFALVFSVSIWHELGHGFTCKRFGGEVHDIGFMIFYLEPAFYCNIDDSYLFDKLPHRVACALGGPYFELMVCATAVGVWLLTPAEWAVHGLALMLVFITGLSVLFNLNPLIKLDGYYVLMDSLDVPSLREESFAYIRNLAKRHLFRLETPEVPISRRRRRIFLLYGLGALAYTALVMVFILVMFRGWFVDWFGPAGYLVLLAAVGYLMRRKISDASAFARHVWLDKRELLRSRRGRGVSLAVPAILLLLLLVPRSATRLDASFEVEPGERAVVRAAADGFVAAVDVEEGDLVPAGAVLGRIDSPELAAGVRRAAADLAANRIEVAAARGHGDAVAERMHSVRTREAATRLGVLDRRLTRQALAAPIGGVVATPDLDLLEGRWVRAGEELIAVDRLDTVRLVISTPESEVESIEPGTAVRLRATAWPGRTLRSTVRSIAPVAVEPTVDEVDRLDLVGRVQLVQIRVEVPNPEGRLTPGMTGRVQFLTEPRSVAGKTWWHFRRWAGSIVW